MNSQEEMKLTYSGIVSKAGKPCVLLRFERGGDYAEYNLPECKLLQNRGFSDEEKLGIEKYIEHNEKDLLQKAKDITGIKHWF